MGLVFSAHLQGVAGVKRVVSCVLSAVLLAASPGIGFWPVLAQEVVTPVESKPAATPDDVGYNGAFSQRIDFKVPEQRGLEPNLGLVYDSAKVNSYGPDDVVAAGWHIRGLSTIQRANSARRGIPDFDDDIYVLDGQELISCGSYAEAGCGAGGTHVTWVENYQRIKYVSANNKWEITARDGTQYIYAPLADFSSYSPANGGETALLNNYRYLLQSKTDTVGQQVVYDYTCDNIVDCRISTVTYDAGEIQFVWEDRPDTITYGAVLALGSVSKRLARVEVRAAGQFVRAYFLSYTQSPATGRSLLSSLQEVGRDAAISNGVLLSGTVMPAYTFQYTGAAPAVHQVANGVSHEGTYVQDLVGFQTFYGDFGADRQLHKVVRTAYEDQDDSGEGAQVEFCTYSNSFTGEYTTTQIPSGYEHCPDWERVAFLKKQHDLTKEIRIRSHWQTYSWAGDLIDHYSGSAPQVVADFDGDGLDDEIEKDENDIISQAYTASGSSQDWAGNGGDSDGARDLNGDGLADRYMWQNAGRDTLEVRYSNGVNAFNTAFAQSLAPVASGWVAPGDFNGDGATDFIVSTDGTDHFRIFYMAGNTFVQGPAIVLTGTDVLNGWARPQPYATDVDGDSRDDFISVAKTDGEDPGKSYVWLNRGATFELIPGTSSTTETFPGGGIADLRDADADGILEAALKTVRSSVTGLGQPSGPYQVFGPERYTFITEKPDLLKVAHQPLGAEVSVTYAHHVAETQLDFPMNLSVVTSLEAYDGRDVRATTSYAYEGAKWDWDHRRFLGFRKITATLPQLAGEGGHPTIETTYRQDLASIGKVEEVIRRDGTGTALQKVQNAYSVQDTTQPYTSLNTETVTYTYLDGTTSTNRVQYAYDSYGLRTTTINYGDDDLTGDEWIHYRWAYPNTAKYIVNAWAVETINSGTVYSYTDDVKWRRWHSFDNQALTTPPVAGLETNVSEWTGNGADDKLTLKTTGYDAYGNVVSEADGLGNTTTYIYDSAYHLFPEEVRNPLYSSDSRQKMLKSWDKSCGVPLTETDENGAVTSYAYDALCRKTRADLPGGGQINYSYQNWGDATQSYNQTSKVHPNGSGNIYVQEYFDGLGRTVETRQAGLTGGLSGSVRVLKEYDTRGVLLRETLPFNQGDTVYWTDYRYDGLDRQILIHHSNGTEITTSYIGGDAFRAVETIDELGNKRVSHFDAFGNEVYRDRYDGSELLRTSFAYDVLKRMIGITDPHGAAWSYGYDRHGNKTALIDPDLGCQQMAYDDANRLVEHRSSSGAQISYTYDALGRMTQKSVDKDALQFPDCSAILNNPEYIWPDDPSVGSLGTATVLTTGDFNGDGRSDFFRLWSHVGENRVYLSRADGGFSLMYNPIPITAANGDPDRVVVGDFNGDGNDDLMLNWAHDGTNRFYYGKSINGFTEVSHPIAASTINGDPDVVRVGDYNGDGRDDLLFYWSHDGTNHFFFGNTDSTFTWVLAPIATTTINGDPEQVVVGDYNGDGRDDLMFNWSHDGTNHFFFGNTDGSFTWVPSLIAASTINGDPEVVRAGDYNGDGRDDLMFNWSHDGTNHFFFGNTDSTFTWVSAPIATSAINGDPDKVVVGDYNGDGRDDLMFYWLTAGTNRFYFGTASNGFTQVTDPIPTGGINSNPDHVLVSDTNGDGNADLSFYWPSTNVMRIYKGQSDQSFVWP